MIVLKTKYINAQFFSRRVLAERNAALTSANAYLHQEVADLRAQTTGSQQSSNQLKLHVEDVVLSGLQQNCFSEAPYLATEDLKELDVRGATGDDNLSHVDGDGFDSVLCNELISDDSLVKKFSMNEDNNNCHINCIRPQRKLYSGIEETTLHSDKNITNVIVTSNEMGCDCLSIFSADENKVALKQSKCTMNETNNNKSVVANNHNGDINSNCNFISMDTNLLIHSTDCPVHLQTILDYKPRTTPEVSRSRLKFEK